MIYIIAIIALTSCYYYIQDTNVLILIGFISVIVTLLVMEMSLGRYIDSKFKLLVDYMEGHISDKEAKGDDTEEEEDD